MTTETTNVYDTVKQAFAPVTEALKTFQNVEVPEAAREFVKKTANSAKERAADVYAGSEKVTAALETAAAARTPPRKRRRVNRPGSCVIAFSRRINPHL